VLAKPRRGRYRITVHARVGGSPVVAVYTCRDALIHMHPSGRTVVTFRDGFDVAGRPVLWKAWRRVEDITRAPADG